MEGVEGDGIGESVTLNLKKPARLVGFTITNGFSGDKSGDRDTLFAANNRVAQLEVKVGDQPSFRVDVPDTKRPSFILFPNGEVMTHKVKLTIAAVYRGTKFLDTCISRIWLRQVVTKKPEVSHAR